MKCIEPCCVKTGACLVKAAPLLWSDKYVVIFLIMVLSGPMASAQFPRFKALAFYSKEVEKAHVDFAYDAIAFFKELTIGNGLFLIQPVPWLILTMQN